MAITVSLERRAVEQPDRQAADEHDPEEDEQEGEVRLSLGIATAGERPHRFGLCDN